MLTALGKQLDRRTGPAWQHTLLRTRSTLLLDHLAGLSSAGRHDAHSLQAEVMAGAPPLLESPVAARAAAAIATLWATQGSARAAGHLLLRRVLDDAGADVLSAEQQAIFAQVAYQMNADGDVRRALAQLDLCPDVRWSLEVDLVNPVRNGSTVNEWVMRLATPFVAAGLAPVTVRPNAATLFDGLGTEPPGPGVDGPLVTVAVPAFQPDEGLVTSVTSLLTQTYDNVEVLVVDDASGPDFAELFERCAALDERVRLIRQPQNGGAYLARNTALSRARGEFITVQDADDWSHPSRIADQVRILQADRSLSASRSDAIRASDDLVMQWVGFLPRRRNASSLMFRRSTAERIGPFDAVRKGADSEYHERLKHFAGPIGDSHTPLSVTRLRAASLSRGDFNYERMAPDRVLYQTAYQRWHRTLRAAGRLPEGIGDPTQRPFAAPRDFLRGITGIPAEHLDVLLVLDGSHRLSATAAQEALSQLPGHRIGFLLLEDASNPRTEQPLPSPAVMDAVNDGAVALVSPDSSARARTTAVLTPNILALYPSPLPRVTTDTLLAVAWPPRVDLTDLLAATDGARAWFDSDPTWCAWDVGAQQEWRADGWDLPLLADMLAPIGER